MSFLSDIEYTFSQKWLREKLTLKERAELLCEITESLDWETYDKKDKQGSYIGKDIDRAMKNLAQLENQDQKMETTDKRAEQVAKLEKERQSRKTTRLSKSEATYVRIFALFRYDDKGYVGYFLTKESAEKVLKEEYNPEEWYVDEMVCQDCI